MPVMMGKPRYTGEPLSQGDIDVVFTGSVYNFGSGPLAEFIVTNPSKSFASSFGSTFLMAASTIETAIKRDLSANSKMPVDEYRRAAAALKKLSP